MHCHRQSLNAVVVLYRTMMSGHLPASSPAQSRVVEAICTHLCTTIQQGRRGGVGVERASRWALIHQAYNRVRASVNNNQLLMEGTNLALFTINEQTLRRWHSKKTRREEVAVLLQGRTLPRPNICAATPLPLAHTQPPTPPQTPNARSFPEPPDTVGQARLRSQPYVLAPPGTSHHPPTPSTPLATSPHITTAPGMPTTTTTIPIPPINPLNPNPNPTNLPIPILATPTVEPPVSLTITQPPKMSRTTAWRHSRQAGPVQRKEHACSVCGASLRSSDHGQYYGQRYCPNRPGQTISKEEWLERKRQERAAVKAAAPQNP